MGTRSIWLVLLVSFAFTLVAPASAQQPKPNILVIMGDDIGYWNISAYNRGMMGEFFYWTDDGNFAGLRYDQYKAVFMEQPAHGLEVWMQPLVPLRAPKLFNLRSDPFERGQYEAGDYVRWYVEHAFVFVPAQAIVAQHIASFQEFPPRQRPGTFSVEQAMEKLRVPPHAN